MQKSISVIIPYYRGRKFIGKCLDSIFESYRNCNVNFALEVVVVLDGFGQDDLDYLKTQYNGKINIIKNENNLGIAQSRNIGRKHSKNEYLLFIDQDDFIDINYFSVTLPFLNGRWDMIVVNGYYLNAKNSKKIPIYYFKPNLNFDSFLKRNPIHTPGQILISSKSFPYEIFFLDCDKQYKGTDDRAAYINAYIKKRRFRLSILAKSCFIMLFTKEILGGT